MLGLGMERGNSDLEDECAASLSPPHPPADFWASWQVLFKKFDENGDENIGLDEVLAFLDRFFLQHKERTFKQAFNIFDTNRSGDICATEVSQMAARGYLCPTPFLPCAVDLYRFTHSVALAVQNALAGTVGGRGTTWEWSLKWREGTSSQPPKTGGRVGVWGEIDRATRRPTRRRRQRRRRSHYEEGC